MGWFGKSKDRVFSVDAVSLHVHERIDARTIVEKALRPSRHVQQRLTFHFDREENNPPSDHRAMQFYRHSHGWSNRMVAGDSLLVMNSLLRREDMAGKVQLVYIDPPYGVKYGSNFQPFVGQKDVRDGRDEDLTREPETVRAFRDTWELEIHSYLSYMRDRLILSRELLSETGSCAVQISDDNLHYVRNLMDEVFGRENFVAIISFKKTTNTTTSHIPVLFDYLVWYAKDKRQLKHHKVFLEKRVPAGDSSYRRVELPGGTRRDMTREERDNPLTLPPGARMYHLSNIMSRGKSPEDDEFEFEGRTYKPGAHLSWRVSLEGMGRLAEKRRIARSGNILRVVKFFDDFGYSEIGNMWDDTSSGGFEGKVYVVQTTAKVVRRLMLMSTDPGDLVLDPTCGSGTTAYVAEQFGRRWITCDTSRVAIALAKKRLMTASYKYYRLRSPGEGVDAGFVYRTARRVTTRSLAYDEEPERVVLHDQPEVDASKARVSGPFTVEAVPSATVRPVGAGHGAAAPDPGAGARARQEEWRAELLRTGIVGRGGRRIEFKRVEPRPSSRWLHAEAATNEGEPRTALVSFGPAHAPLESRQVRGARAEVEAMGRRPDLVVFAALQFDAEASREIDSPGWPARALKAQMNADMMTADLKRGDAGSQSFVLIGQPEVELADAGGGSYRASVRGFDYYDPAGDEVVSGGPGQIAMWMLDTDYDGRSLYPQQVFFPMAGAGGGWDRIARTLRPYVDEDLISRYSGTESIPFRMGGHGRVAVKIIDHRGIESMRVLEGGGCRR